MKLVRATIENHSRLQDVDLRVSDHLVIVGPNDVGKSSLLRALDLLLGRRTPQIYASVTEDDLRDRSLPFVVNADFQAFSDDDKALFPDEITIDASTANETLRVRLEVTADEAGTIEVRRFAPDAGHGRQLSREQQSGLGWRLIAATSRDRDVRDSQSGALRGLLDDLDLGDERVVLEKLIADFQNQLATSPSLGTLRADLAKHLSRALPEQITPDDLAFVAGAVTEGDVLRDVNLRITRDGSSRQVGDQSDGTRALFALALYDLVSTSAYIVAIDEPEAHLHPTSQRSLARLLQAGQNQKLVSTHSSDIVGSFAPDQVVAIKPGGVVVQPGVGFLDDDERMVARWWMRDKLEPLAARTVLGVEGLSDRILVEGVAAVAGGNLDRLGAAIVETGGSGGMKAILKLFGAQGFDIPLRLLIDEDARDETASAVGVAAGDLEAQPIFVSNPDLEAEYVSAIGAAEFWTALTASALFSPNELANCTCSGPIGTRTSADVAAFCRRNKSGYKVRAAMVAAKHLTEATARNVRSVQALLAGLT